MKSGELKVLGLASGSGAPYLILRDLGWSIEKWVSCEIDKETSRVAKGINPQIRSPCHELLEMAKMESNGTYDLVLAATPCKGFSGASDELEGMGGHDGDLLKAVANIVNKVKKNNPHVRILMENVKLHPKLQGQAAMQDSLIGIHFKK